MRSDAEPLTSVIDHTLVLPSSAMLLLITFDVEFHVVPVDVIAEARKRIDAMDRASTDKRVQAGLGVATAVCLVDDLAVFNHNVTETVAHRLIDSLLHQIQQLGAEPLALRGGSLPRACTWA